MLNIKSRYVANPKQVLLRLKNEKIRLQGQDPYTLLGIAPDSPDEMLRNAAERMIQRYSKLSKDPALPTEAQEIAADLKQLMERAEARLLNERENQYGQEEQVPAPPPTDVKSTEELAFSEGSKAFAAGNFQRAMQCFKKARDERIDSVRNLCWLGWAIFHNQEMPADQREEEALDMLRLANSFNPQHSQACFFLAYVERELGESDKAEVRLINLLRHNEDHREAKKLLRSIQRKKKR